MNTQTKQKYIKHNGLFIDENENQAILLGYKLNLTKTEYQILKALAQNGDSPLSSEEFSSIANLELSKENLAFHVFNINRKAKFISNRILIKNIAKIGYFLN